jgi:hypothetical protein
VSLKRPTEFKARRQRLRLRAFRLSNGGLRFKGIDLWPQFGLGYSDDRPRAEAIVAAVVFNLPTLVTSSEE